MKIVPFTIQIRNNIHTGFLGTSDLSDPPTNFFVFIDNFIVGDLLYKDKWIFDQGARHNLLDRLDTSECNFIADCLGNIAVSGCQSNYSKPGNLKAKAI